MARDEPGDGRVTGSRTPTDPWIRLLTQAVVLVAVLAVIGGVFAFREHQTRSDGDVSGERYGDVQKAAADEAMALLNIDYRDPQKTIDAVKSGATDEFAKEFDSAQGGLIQLTAQAKSVMTGEVLWTGVVDVDPDSATVIVATTGTVTNTQTGNAAASRNFRIKIDLVKQDGRWLTSALDFVQVAL